mmetsp:Transcript_32173/g.80899  ORF Transcript_32173/g.80899 Transcript_32173/m.80899 type:complete len:108 (-) Transcript_32173:671-994(-)
MDGTGKRGSALYGGGSSVEKNGLDEVEKMRRRLLQLACANGNNYLPLFRGQLQQQRQLEQHHRDRQLQLLQKQHHWELQQRRTLQVQPPARAPRGPDIAQAEQQDQK